MAGRVDVSRLAKTINLTPEDWVAKADEADFMFTPGAPIEERDLYSGRRAQINALMEAVKERGQHAVLFGERGVGKTSTSRIFRELMPSTLRNVNVVRVRAYESDSFSKLWHRILENIKITILDEGKRRVVTISYILDAHISPDDVFRELAKAFSPNDVTVIIIDEFQEIKDKKIVIQIANLIKTLSDESVNVTILIVGVSDNVSDLIALDKSVERCLTQVRMPRMTPGELEDILDQRIPRLGMSITEEAVWRITCLSRGLPAYVHNLGKYAVRGAIHRKSLEVEERDVELAIANVLDKTKHSNFETYQQAVHSNKRDARFKQTLMACALAQNDEAGFFSPIDVIEPLRELLGRNVALADFQKHLDQFQLDDRGAILVRRGTAKKFRYRFREPIMQPFVIMKGIETGIIPPRSKSLLSYTRQKSLSI
jgi:Cdc6-like AAA superfamily ATPase